MAGRQLPPQAAPVPLSFTDANGALILHEMKAGDFLDDEASEGPMDIDVSLLEDSLRLTVWQRLLENGRALALVRMLETAKNQHDGRPNSTSGAS